MDGIYFEITKEIALKLRDDAVMAALDAEIKKDKWFRAVMMLSIEELEAKFGRWRELEGVLSFSDSKPHVKLLRVDKAGFTETAPVIWYCEKLKSGKFSKSEHYESVDYVLDHFTPIERINNAND